MNSYPLNSEVVDSRTPASRSRCHKSGDDVLRKQYPFNTTVLEGYKKRLTSFKENGPGLMKRRIGESESKGVPFTQLSFGNTVAHALPAE